MIRPRFELALFFLLSSPTIWPQNSPQWRGPNRDGIIASYAMPQTWPVQLKRKWKIKVGIGHSSPLLVGKNIFTFTRQGGVFLLRVPL